MDERRMRRCLREKGKQDKANVSTMFRAGEKERAIMEAGKAGRSKGWLWK